MKRRIRMRLRDIASQYPIPRRDSAMQTEHQIILMPDPSADTICDKVMPTGDSAEALARLAEDNAALEKELARLRMEVHLVKAKPEAAEARLCMTSWTFEEIMECEG